MADSDMIKGLNKAIDAATGKTGTDYTYLNTTPVTEKLDELAEAIANSGGGGGGGVPQVQSDWTETDTSSKAYIKHKPTLANVATSGSYNDLSDKPTIPAAQVQSDWNETDTTSLAYIKNKPSAPISQVQSDWNETDTSDVSYIKNKPYIPVYYEATGTLEAGQTSITLTHNAINSTSRLLYYFPGTFGVSPKNAVVSSGSVTLTFDAQLSDIDVVVQIWPALPADPESGLKITNIYSTSVSGTYTVDRAGLYFVSCTYYYNSTDTTVTITSSNAPIIQNYNSVTKYYFINLNVGDTVEFIDSVANPGALIGNVSLVAGGIPKSVISYDLRDGATIYTTPNDDKLYFVFAACADMRDGEAYDTSTVGPKATTYAYGRSDTHAYMRLASCVGDDVTIRMNGWQFGSVSILTVEMERT